MTRMSERKSRLLVEFSDSVREHGKNREVTMEFSPYLVTVRLKGLRTRYQISPAAIYNRAVMIEVDRRRAERKAAKRPKHGKARTR